MLLLDSSVCGLFKWRQFEPEVILLAIGWYLRFSLSYRDVEELLAERGLSVDHVTVWRWVQRYAPELERRLRRHLKPTNDRIPQHYVCRSALFDLWADDKNRQLRLVGFRLGVQRHVRYTEMEEILDTRQEIGLLDGVSVNRSLIEHCNVLL